MPIDVYTRNTKPDFYNTNRNANCGSFALNVKEWFYPYCFYIKEVEEGYDEIARNDLIEDLICSGCTREEIMEGVLHQDWQYILAVCPFLEEIDIRDAKKEDRIIAYRLMLTTLYTPEGDIESVEDEDFHFRVRINGFWFDKCGGKEVRFLGTETDENPWIDENDLLCYDSNIRYARFIET